jgi:hypothetical protein
MTNATKFTKGELTLAVAQIWSPALALRVVSGLPEQVTWKQINDRLTARGWSARQILDVMSKLPRKAA